jgi:hypothetical protein
VLWQEQVKEDLQNKVTRTSRAVVGTPRISLMDFRNGGRSMRSRASKIEEEIEE